MAVRFSHPAEAAAAACVGAWDKAQAAPQGDAHIQERGRPLVQEVTLLVKNTFIAASSVRSPSLDGFFQERQVLSCPNTPVSKCGLRPATGAPELELASSRSTADTDEFSWEEEPDQPSSVRGLRRARTWAAVEESKALDDMGRSPDFDDEPLVPSLAHPRMQADRSHQASQLRGVPVLRLEEALTAPPPLPPTDLPSAGSAGHHLRQCKPCAFVHAAGCSNGVRCTFCHICEPGEKKRRQKEKRAVKRLSRDGQPDVAEPLDTHGAPRPYASSAGVGPRPPSALGFGMPSGPVHLAR